MPVLDLSAYKPVPGTLEDANQIANGFTALQTCINGLDNNNFAAGKIFDPLKLMQDGAVAGQALVWSAAANGGTGGWVPGTVATSYRKTTAKVVNTSVAETDLLNGEITIGAGAIGASGMLRIHARGDWKQNSGGAGQGPRFKLKLGATTLLDTGVMPGNTFGNSATRWPWRIDALIANLGATNSQWATISGIVVGVIALLDETVFTVGEGSYWTPVSETGGAAYLEGGNAAAVDTTAAQALALSVINASANANYEVALKHATVEVV